MTNYPADAFNQSEDANLPLGVPAQSAEGVNERFVEFSPFGYLCPPVSSPFHKRAGSEAISPYADPITHLNKCWQAS
ncbi:hypothetical protein BH10CYA1_BH10CYA1_63390 [soil metagenome]